MTECHDETNLENEREKRTGETMRAIHHSGSNTALENMHGKVEIRIQCTKLEVMTAKYCHLKGEIQ